MENSAGNSAPPSTLRPDAGEASPFDVVNAGASSPFLLIGDHAGRRIPTRLGDLGLGQEDLARHIAWDIGVDGLGRQLASRLGAAFIAQRYSRLVIDCNRDPSRADSIVEISDGAAVPANAMLPTAEARRRREEIFDPYHARIAEELDGRRARGLPTLIVALHSFTPVMSEIVRPWRYGVLHMHDSAFSSAVLASLAAAVGAAEVGDNEPYRMDETDYSIARHAQARGLDYLELEVRQDLIGDVEGWTREAKRLAEVLVAAMDRQ